MILTCHSKYQHQPYQSPYQYPKFCKNRVNQHVNVRCAYHSILFLVKYVYFYKNICKTKTQVSQLI